MKKRQIKLTGYDYSALFLFFVNIIFIVSRLGSFRHMSYTPYATLVQLFPILILIMVIIYNWKNPHHWRALTRFKKSSISLAVLIISLLPFYSFLNFLLMSGFYSILVLLLGWLWVSVYLDGANAFVVWVRSKNKISMKKENKQFIVVLVIVLAAVALIDIGNSQLSGKLVDRKNVAGKIIDLDARPTTEDQDATFVQQQPPILDPTSIAPQPVPECTGVEDLTDSLARKFPNDHLREVYALDDRQMRYFIFQLGDKITGTNHWVIYDIGSDNLFISNDDKWYDPSMRRHGWFKGEIGIKADGNEKLFWIDYDASNNPIVISCTLPACNDGKKELTLTTEDIELVSPSLLNNRLVLMLRDQTTNDRMLKSCSLNANDPDSCNNPSQYKTHAAGSRVYGVGSIRDGSMLYSDYTTSNQEFIFSSFPVTKIIPVPWTIIYESLRRMSPGTPYMTMVRITNQLGVNITEILVLDLITGAITTVEQLNKEIIGAPFTGSYNNKIYAIFEIFSPPEVYYLKKEVGKQETKIGSLPKWSMHEAKQLANGKIIGMSQTGPQLVVSFDCTP